MNTSAGRCQDSTAIYFQSNDANYTLEFYKEKSSSKICSDSTMKSARSVTDQLPDISGLPSATKSSTQCRVYLNLAMELSTTVA